MNFIHLLSSDDLPVKITSRLTSQGHYTAPPLDSHKTQPLQQASPSPGPQLVLASGDHQGSLSYTDPTLQVYNSTM